MFRYLLPLSLLVACTPSPRKAAMPSPEPAAAAADRTPEGASASDAAMPGPVPPPVSAAGIAAPPMPLPDSPAAALGRRTLSTAFVRVGPDGRLTVELHGGRVLVLRDVEMGPRKYCGLDAAGARYCGGYAEVAAARPG